MTNPNAHAPRNARPRCPRCSSRDVLPIVYGLLREPIPGVIPGGCAYSSDLPLWRCQTCVAAWRDRDENGRFAKPTETHDEFEQLLGDVVSAVGGTLIGPDGKIIQRPQTNDADSGVEAPEWLHPLSQRSLSAERLGDSSRLR